LYVTLSIRIDAIELRCHANQAIQPKVLRRQLSGHARFPSRSIDHYFRLKRRTPVKSQRPSPVSLYAFVEGRSAKQFCSGCDCRLG
jgi:hypothetical protein